MDLAEGKICNLIGWRHKFAPNPPKDTMDCEKVKTKKAYFVTVPNIDQGYLEIGNGRVFKFKGQFSSWNNFNAAVDEEIAGSVTKSYRAELKALNTNDVTLRLSSDSGEDGKLLNLSYQHSWTTGKFEDVVAAGEIEILNLIPASKFSLDVESLYQAHAMLKVGTSAAFDAKFQMNEDVLRFKLKNNVLYDLEALLEVNEEKVALSFTAESTDVRLSARNSEDYKV